MQKIKVLVLTDHTNHSAENSVYSLLQSMCKHHRCEQIDVATRANTLNDSFFKKLTSTELMVSKVEEDFAFSTEGKSYQNDLRKKDVADFDVVWLRLPPPLSKPFLIFLKHKFPNLIFINDPDGIYETGSKEFLFKFPEVCAPMKICKSEEDILEFSQQFPIVLKPFRDYGGRGIVKVDGEKVWERKNKISLQDFFQKMKNTKVEYLGVKFLKNVSKGDKRIVVVNGRIIGASLRLPPEDSWICNVSMGGSSTFAEVDAEEIKIVNRINPTLEKLGIVMYGVDTLVDDDGKRILSEINTTSIGGIPQMEKQQGKPLVKATTDQIWNFIRYEMIKKNITTN